MESRYASSAGRGGEEVKDVKEDDWEWKDREWE
jgi:hypothetical protein